MGQNGYRMAGQALFALDILWMIGWFSMCIWFIVDNGVDNLFRDAARNLLFHYANTGGIAYVLRFGANRWDAGVPFFFALLADIEAAVTIVVNVPPTHMGARTLLLNWSWFAVGLTVFGLLWFLAAPTDRRPAHYASTK